MSESAGRLSCLAAFGLLAALAAQQSTESRVRELAPGVFFWQGDRETQRQTNLGWVVFGDYILVIDANFPWGARDVLPEIRKTSAKPIRFVFNTHYHADHAYGNVVFAEAGATVICTEACAEESHRKGPGDVKNQAKERATEAIVHPSLQFQERLTFDDGSHRVELIRAGPAHSKGDAVAWLPKEKILFAGDLAVNWELGNNVGDADADHANWVRALERIAAWDPAIVIPGHGVPGDVATLHGQRAYLAAMLDGVLAGIRGHKNVDQIAREIDLSQHRPFGADPRRTASQLRSMYRGLTKINETN
jgi:cyclase